MSPAHAEAVEAARAFIASRAREEWHTVASVVLTASGKRYLSINLDSTLPRAGVCAEPVSIGMAMSEDPDDRISFCAAVNRRGEVIPPCGVCRELLLDYAAEAMVAIPDGSGFRTVPLTTLVPAAYKADRRKM